MSSKIAVLALSAALVVLSSCGSNDTSYPTNPGSGAPKELNSPDIGPGAAFEHRFLVAGSFPYHCIHHSPMTGTVQVNAAAADTLVNVSIISFTTPFPAASVKPGGRVVWTNNTTMTHTVTSN